MCTDFMLMCGPCLLITREARVPWHACRFVTVSQLASFTIQNANDCLYDHVDVWHINVNILIPVPGLRMPTVALLCHFAGALRLPTAAL